MSRKTKAFAAAISLAASLLAPNSLAASDGTGDLADHFAICLGRYAAQQDYDGLMGRDVTDAAARAEMFSDLLNAVADPSANRSLYKSRKGAEGAHWTLLHSADFSFDDRLARHAKQTAERNIAMCEMLVLG